MKVLAAVLFALITMPAGAADFVFNVPVRLNNLDARVTTLSVVCQVFAPSGNIGLRSVSISIPANGNYSDTVRMEVNVLAGRNPAEATGYRCELANERGSLGGQVERRNTQADPALAPSSVLPDRLRASLLILLS